MADGTASICQRNKVMKALSLQWHSKLTSNLGLHTMAAVRDVFETQPSTAWTLSAVYKRQEYGLRCHAGGAKRSFGRMERRSLLPAACAM